MELILFMLQRKCWILSSKYSQTRHRDSETSRWVFMARLRPQFGMPPSFDRSTPQPHRFNYNIPASVVLLQQCHCRNRHRGKLQNVSSLSVLFESSWNFFTIHRIHRRKKRWTRILKFELCDWEFFWNFQKGIARSLCGWSGPLWSRQTRSE